MQLTSRTLSQGRTRRAQARKVLPIFTLVLALCSLLPGRVQAISDQLDPTFGDSGKVLTDFSGLNDFTGDMIVQPDGKVIVVGTSYGSDFSHFAMARYNTDGTLDSSFGNGGQVSTTFPGLPVVPSNYTEATAVTLQPDHKIVVGGSNGLDFALARYNEDGTLDDSFGAGGIVFNPNSNRSRKISDVAILPDGKIIAAGWHNGILDEQGYILYGFALSRYNADGTLDSTFGTGGLADSELFGRGVGIQAIIEPDGQILFRGVDNTVIEGSQVLARFNPDGTPDSTFGTGGRFNIFFDQTHHLIAMAAQPDKKIVIVGQEIGVTGYDFSVSRYNIDGTLDSAFGSGGKVITDLGSTGDLSGTVAIQPDGKIVVSGQTFTDVNLSYDFAAVRYHADGTLDSTFGSGGKVITDFGHSSEFAWDSIIQPDGKIILAGYRVIDTSTGPNYDFALARYTSGAIDTAPPTITCPSNITASSSLDQCSTTIDPGIVMATDNAGHSLTPVGVRSDGKALSEPYPVGTTTITWTATDSNGNTATCSQVVTVIDNTPPVISAESVNPAVLWSPNHQMVNVTVSYDATDNCALVSSVTNALSVTSNELANGSGDGNTASDWEVVDAHHVRLRAERAGNGYGRIYTITIVSTDGNGNTSNKQVTVSVPHGKR